MAREYGAPGCTLPELERRNAGTVESVDNAKNIQQLNLTAVRAIAELIIVDQPKELGQTAC